MKKIENLKVKIFADGADKLDMFAMYNKPYIKGLTTNPTLMRKSGIKDYRSFCKEILIQIKDKPISFEVFSDDFLEMERQAIEIASWGENVYVKIPILNTKGISTASLIQELSHSGVKVNVTAVLTEEQIQEALKVLAGGAPSILSIFAGRIADTARDPNPLVKDAVEAAKKKAPSVEVLWASTREVYNLIEAEKAGCQIITVPGSILEKYRDMRTKTLHEVSLDTVKTFKKDSDAAGYSL